MRRKERKIKGEFCECILWRYEKGGSGNDNER